MVRRDLSGLVRARAHSPLRPGLDAATRFSQPPNTMSSFTVTPLDLNKTCVELHLEASYLYYGSAAQLQEHV